MSKGPHVTRDMRIRLEALYSARHTPKEIAALLGLHLSTVYRELNRGAYQRMTTQLTLVRAYSADIAQADYDRKQTAKGAPLKLGHDYAFAAYVEDMILQHRYSPDAIIGRIRWEGLCFDTQICTRTLYNYIYGGVFLRVSSKDLLRQGQRRRKPCERPERVKRPLCRSIEERSEGTRQEAGHWEIDTVIGKANKRPCLLVLTERQSRYELMFKIRGRTQDEVIRQLAAYRRKHPYIPFRTVTCDNGSEFLDSKRLERTLGAVVYYCHPYSAWERGSNENANAMVRRFIPKGKDISRYTQKEIAAIQDWLNNYPRKILGYRTSAEVFFSEIQ